MSTPEELAAAAAVYGVGEKRKDRDDQAEVQQPPPKAIMTEQAPEARLCFPFLNKGVCERGTACRFRHVPPDHPDAVADRVQRSALGYNQPKSSSDTYNDVAQQLAMANAMAQQQAWAQYYGVAG